MKRNLTFKESVGLSSMLFGMFFGAGNLIFPALLGIQSGSNYLLAFLGVFITAVGIPMLAVVALGLSRSEGVQALSARVSPGFSRFFCTALYLTIGPLFAIPRCASAAFSVGAVNLLPPEHHSLYLALFSLVFFLIVLLFSLKPGKILTWIGKFLNPVFLVFLAVLVVTALLHPVNSPAEVVPAADYTGAGAAFFRGFLEGYNTLDALAGLAFGIVVIRVVREQGISDPGRVAVNTARAGIFSCLFMGFIYFCITLISVRGYGSAGAAADGGEVLGLLSSHYFHAAGAILITAIVGFACLKTALGLVISCSEALMQLYPKGPAYPVWAAGFTLLSFGIANLGLSSIVAWCVPVLMFLYPLAIVLILLALLGKYFRHSSIVYRSTIAFTLIPATLDFVSALAGILPDVAPLQSFALWCSRYIPLFSLGLSWIFPAAIGFALGLLWCKFANRGNK